MISVIFIPGAARLDRVGVDVSVGAGVAEGASVGVWVGSMTATGLFNKWSMAACAPITIPAIMIMIVSHFALSSMDACLHLSWYSSAHSQLCGLTDAKFTAHYYAPVKLANQFVYSKGYLAVL